MRHTSGLERRSIVAAGLETTRALGRYAIVFAGDAYVGDAESCLEVRAYGRYKDDKGVFGGRVDTNAGADTYLEGADI